MNVLESIISQQVIQKLGWTLIHFLWQGVAVALLLAILLKLLRKSSANLRYIAACLALGFMVLLPAITLKLVAVSVAISTPTEPARIESILDSAEAAPMMEAPLAKTAVPGESLPIPPSISWRQSAISVLENALPYIVSGWLIGVFGLSVWHLGGWAQLQRLRRRMVKQVSERVRLRAGHLAEQMGVKRAVAIMESALVQVPTVVGWLKPVILLPASALTGLSGQQIEAILAHELAHIKRLDYLVNMLQTVVEILGFYHPAVWWVSYKIRAERENCCDDLAVSISGDRVHYARALTSMEEIRAGYELAVAATGGSLFDRIRRLVGRDNASKEKASWIPSVIAILLIMALVIPTALALSDGAGHKPDNQESYRIRHFVRLIVGRDKITFQGKETSWDQLPNLLKQVGHRNITVLEVGFTKFFKRTKDVSTNKWLNKKAVWRKTAQLCERFGFEYLSFVGKHKLGAVSGGTRNYLVRPMKFGKEIKTNLPSAEDKPLVYLSTIEFSKGKAVIRGKVTSYPKTKWDIEIAFFDQKMRRLDYVFKKYENSGIIKGVAVNHKEIIEVNISKIKNLEKAKFFELSIKQTENRDQHTLNSKKIVDIKHVDVDIKPVDFDIRFDSKRGVCNLVVSIQNDSKVAIPKFKLRFYRGDAANNLDEAGNIHRGWHEAGPIEPRKRWNERTRDFHLPDGQYEFQVVLDYDDNVPDVNEANNRAVLQVKISRGRIVEKSVSYPSRLKDPKPTGQDEPIKKPDVQVEGANEGNEVGYTVAGRVLTKPGGEAVAGAIVNLWCGSGKSLTTEASADGTYTFKNVKPSKFGYVLRIKNPPGIWTDWISLDVKDENVEDKNLYLTLPQSISGTVRDAETSEPVAGAEIRISTNGNCDGIKTGSDGKFRLYVNPREVSLICDGTKERYYPHNEYEKQLTVSYNENIVNIDFKVKSAPQFTGQVSYADGRPAENIPVLVKVLWQSNVQRSAFFDAGLIGRDFKLKTNTKGKFVGYLRRPIVRDWQELIKLKAIAWLPDRSMGGVARAETNTREPSVEPMKILLGEAGSATIRVVDPNGKPIKNAKVTASDIQPGYLTASDTLLDFEHPHFGGPVKYIGDGQYHITNLVPGLDYYIAAHASGYRPSKVVKVEKFVLEPGEDFHAGTLTLDWWGKKAVPGLVKQLHSPDMYDREGAARLLGSLGEDAIGSIPILIKLLRNDQRNTVRYTVAEALGKIGPAAKDAVPELIWALEHESGGGVKREAAKALGLIGDPAALPALQSALNDTINHVRDAAAVAIKQIEQAQKGNVQVEGGSAEKVGEIGKPKLVAKAYDVSTLLERLSGPYARSWGGRLSGRFDENGMDKDKLIAKDIEAAKQSLIRRITNMIEPNSWEMAGGDGVIKINENNELIILQTTENQKKVQKLLDAMERSQQILIESRFLLVQADSSEIKDFFESEKIAFPIDQEDPNFSNILNDEQVSRLLKLVQTDPNSKSLAAPRVTVLDGEQASVQISRTIMYGHADANSTSGQPEPKKLNVGTLIQVKPTLQNQGQQISLSLARRYKLSSPSEATRILWQYNFTSTPIILEVEYEHTSLLGFENDLPQTETASGQVRVEILNGQTILLGGQKMAEDRDGQEVTKTLLCLVKAEKVEQGNADND